MSYSQQVVAEVMADLALGMTKRQAAAKHGVSHVQVGKWAKKFPEASRKRSIQDALEGYVMEVLETLQCHLRLSRDEEYIRQHAPNDIAIFDGVHSDKCFRILDAFAKVQQQEIATGTNATDVGQTQGSNGSVLPPVNGTGQNGHGPPLDKGQV